MFRSHWTCTLAALALLATPFIFADRALAIQDSEDKVWFWSCQDHTVRVFDRRGTLVSERRLQLAPGVIGSVELAVADQDSTIAVPLSRRTFRAEIVEFNPQPDRPGKWAVRLEVVVAPPGSN
jgi:hypothetical protein